ncbi:hypothetical protein JOF55_004337 [Haloactinomyces albus]|uniref:Uncharacterized protein n=1 Tax=Haloactinomyces albus TaxID=1352928 RepID=A0AAE3ZHS3_9ACTN|nr:hypothetical protein [Haloactinomyces albus]
MKINSEPKGSTWLPICCHARCAPQRAWSLARLLGTDQRECGTRKGRRALTVFWHAMLTLRWFRDGTRLA